MVYRTPSPPPEEPKMKEPFKVKDWHLATATYICVWIVVLSIYAANRTSPNSLYGLIGGMAALHALGLIAALGIRNLP